MHSEAGKIMNNKSAPYGYYGGVTQQNHYVPPSSVPFVPHEASVPFYRDYRTTLQHLVSSVNFTQEFLLQNAGSILVRKIVEQMGNSNHFHISTLDHPDDLITYDTLSGYDVNLLGLDGGSF